MNILSVNVNMFLLLIIMHSLEILYLLQLNFFPKLWYISFVAIYLLMVSEKTLRLKCRVVLNTFFGSWWISMFLSFILPFYGVFVCRRPVHEKVILNLIICNFFHYCFITSSTNMLGKAHEIHLFFSNSEKISACSDKF